jgi:hypothetical protein
MKTNLLGRHTRIGWSNPEVFGEIVAVWSEREELFAAVINPDGAVLIMNATALAIRKWTKDEHKATE